MPELQLLEASGNNFNSRLPNVSLKANASFALFNINMFYGSVTFVITSSVLLIRRAIISEVGYQIMHRGRHLLVSIAYRMCRVRGVQEIRMCIVYSERGLVFDNFGLPMALNLLLPYLKRKAPKIDYISSCFSG